MQGNDSSRMTEGGAPSAPPMTDNQRRVNCFPYSDGVAGTATEGGTSQPKPAPLCPCGTTLVPVSTQGGPASPSRVIGHHCPACGLVTGDTNHGALGQYDARLARSLDGVKRNISEAKRERRAKHTHDDEAVRNGRNVVIAYRCKTCGRQRAGVLSRAQSKASTRRPKGGDR